MPQALVLTDRRLQEVNKEFKRISDLGLRAPGWDCIQKQDLRIWDSSTIGTILRPAKPRQATDPIGPYVNFWAASDEQVYF
jgi:hypothetical protein